MSLKKELILFCLLCLCNFAHGEKPNVLFISIDDLNDWIGVMETHPDVQTPNIDRLAKRGMLFKNTHCQFPVCGPSRASIFSGYYPTTLEAYNNDAKTKDATVQKTAKERSNQLMHEYVRSHGYKTMAVGKLMHSHVPKDSVDESGGRFNPPKSKTRLNFNSKNTGTDWGVYPGSDSEMADHIQSDWAIAKLKEKHEKPFLLMLGLQLPHVPWIVPQKYWDIYDQEDLTLAPFKEDDLKDVPQQSRETNLLNFMPQTQNLKEIGKLKQTTQSYLASISFIDHQIGRVLDTLEQSDYKDNTIVMFWSDHGYHIGEKGSFQKHSLWQRATRVPLIISTPTMTSATVCQKPVELLDLYPTLLELCQLPSNPHNEGKSLLPLLHDPNKTWDHVAITTYRKQLKHCKATGVPFQEEPSFAIYDERYHYIFYNDQSEELYDLNNDPNEWYNLSNSPEHESIKTKLRQAFKKQLPSSQLFFQ